MAKISDIVNVFLMRRGSNRKAAAAMLGQTPPNLYKKFSRDTLNSEEVHGIASGLGCDCSLVFQDKTTGEVIYKESI